jgi:hypothetical protein
MPNESGVQFVDGIFISFADWAWSTLNRMRKVVGLGGLLVTAVAISYLEPSRWFSLWLTSGEFERLLDGKLLERANLAFVQAVVCLLLAILTPPASIPAAFRKIKERLRVRIAKRACIRIRRLVVFLFCLWSAYYIITGIKLLSAYAGHPTDLVDRAFLISLSGLTSLCLFWLYLEMGEITIETSASDSPRLDADVYKTMAIGFYVILVIVLWYGYVTSEERVIDAIDIVVACLSGIGLCFVVGRFADKLLNPGPVTLFLLYFYSVIQLGAAIMQNEPLVHLAVTTMALPLKILLWLVCVWAFTTGILGEYLYELRVLIERVEAQRASVEELQEATTLQE